MLSLLLANWKIAIIVGLVTALAWQSWVSNERGHAIESMKITIAELAQYRETCEKNKKITEDVSYEYQGNLARLNTHLAKLRRTANKCPVPVASNPAGASNPTGQAKPARQTGVDPEALFDLAGQGDEYRIRLIGLQSIINQLRSGER